MEYAVRKGYDPGYAFRVSGHEANYEGHTMLIKASREGTTFDAGGGPGRDVGTEMLLAIVEDDLSPGRYVMEIVTDDGVAVPIGPTTNYLRVIDNVYNQVSI